MILIISKTTEIEGPEEALFWNADFPSATAIRDGPGGSVITAGITTRELKSTLRYVANTSNAIGDYKKQLSFCLACIP